MTMSYSISTLFYILPCFFLIILAFWDRLKRHHIPKIFICILSFSAAAFFSSCIYLKLDSPLLRAMLSLPVLFFGIFLFCSLAIYNFWQGIFIIAVTNCYIENIYLLSLYIHFAITKIFPYLSGLKVIYTTIPLTLITFPFAYMFSKRLLRPALDYTVSLNIWRTMWIIPICNTIIHSLTVTPNISGPYFTPGNAFFFVPPLWTLSSFTTYTIILRMIISLSKNAILQETLHLSEIKINAQQKQLDTLQLYIEQSRRSRHDTQHHILAIKGFLEKQDNKGLNDYLDKLAELFPAFPANYCENPAINSLLCYYREITEREQIKTSFSIALDSQIPFPDTDLCIILGNFLENAVEACRRMKSQERYIDLKISMPSRLTLVIITKNSYEGTIQQAQDGTFLSSKEKQRKGIGISSVTNIIEKYNGISRFDYQEPVFKAFLLLNAKEQPT